MDTLAKPNQSFAGQCDSQEKKKLALTHPKFKGRADRLDLITNSMLGMRIAINGKNLTVCDISDTGFSYAERVPVKNNLSFKQVRLKVDQIAQSNYGKSIKSICFFEGEPMRGGVETKGTIKNHLLFLVLSEGEIGRTITAYLQSQSIRRSHDPQGFFHKLDLLLYKARDMKEKGYNGVSLGIAINTTFQNLILEIGAPFEIFDKLYQGYINKPVYVKYGVSLDDHKEAISLNKFAALKNTDQIKTTENQKMDLLSLRMQLIQAVNQKYNFNDFILIVWKNALKQFSLDLNLDLPKVEKETLSQKLKNESTLYDGYLEKLADPEFKNGESKGVETYLCTGLYWHLIEKDKKYFDREVIKKELRKVISFSFNACLQSLEEEVSNGC